MPGIQSVTGFIIAAIVAVTLSACDSGPEVPAAPKMAVKVAAAEQMDFPLSIELTGSTYGNQDVPIRARVEGFLISVNFREGRMVSEGDLLYTIDPEPFQAKVVEAQSALAAEQTRYAKAKADLERIRPLAEMKAVSEQDLDGAVAQEKAASAAVQAATARLDLAQIELGYTKIYAPIDGLIGLTKARPGEFVGREPNPVVLNTLSDISPIRVRFSISEREYLELARSMNREGQQRNNTEAESAEMRSNDQIPLELILSDGTVYEEIGYVDGSAQSIDSSTGTFTVEALFPNPNGILLPGQFARVRAPYSVIKDAIVVPRQAVVEFQGRYQVYVVSDDNIVSVRPVEKGPEKGNDAVIQSGLQPGEIVVVEGTQKVRPEMEVVVQPYVPPDFEPVPQDI